MATKADLVIDQGTTFSTDLTLADQNGNKVALAGYTASSQIRKWYTSLEPSAVFATNINANTATITLQLTADATSQLDSGRYVYDVEITDGSTVSRIVEGIVTVTPQVTR
jgi:hypothetical protein